MQIFTNYDVWLLECKDKGLRVPPHLYAAFKGEEQVGYFDIEEGVICETEKELREYCL